MQIASRQPLWNDWRKGTVVTVEMTAATGLYIRFVSLPANDGPIVVRWGDGTRHVCANPSEMGEFHWYDHTYAQSGRYRITITGIGTLGFVINAKRTSESYFASVVSVADYTGQISTALKYSFDRAVNMEKLTLPNCTRFEAGSVERCTKLSEVVVNDCDYIGSGAFQNDTSLETFTAGRLGLAELSPWSGCTAMREMRFADVKELGNRAFGDMPNLTDIWIEGRTVAQIMQTAPTGNIISHDGTKFPWAVSNRGSVRFHGSDGIVLGDGTIIG